MDRVIVKDVAGGIQKHDCKNAWIDQENKILYIRKNENSEFGYNIDNLISYSIVHMGKNGKEEAEE